MKITLAALAAITTASALHAQTFYWNPTTTPRQHGNAVWSTSANAWAAALAGTATPFAWTNGCNAYFNPNNPNVGTTPNTATVNNVIVGSMNIQTGVFTFERGTGPLTLSGPLIARQTATFNTDVVIAEDQDWDFTGAINLYGSLTGPGALRRIAGTPNLNLYNTTNTLPFLHAAVGTIQACAGGSITATNGTLVLGAPAQGNNAAFTTLEPDDPAAPAYSAGDLVASGFADLTLANHPFEFGGLYRENGGVLGVKGDLASASFTNGADLVVNGMLPPWVIAPDVSGANPQGPLFLTYENNGLKTIPDQLNPAVWDDTKVVKINAADLTLANSATVLALRCSSGRSLNVPSGKVLTLASGGLVLQGTTSSAGASILGDGEIECGDKELVVFLYNNNTPATPGAIHPRINANGLTLWTMAGNNNTTLVVSNMTWRGDTHLQRGHLRAFITLNTTYTNNIRGTAIGTASGYFTKDGPGLLTLKNTDSKFSCLILTGGNVDIVGGRVECVNGISHNNGRTLTIAGGEGLETKFLSGVGVTIGTGANANNNTVLVDGKGVAGSASLEASGGLMVGDQNTRYNTLTVTDGGIAKGGNLTVGRKGEYNTATFDGVGTEYVGDNNSAIWVGAQYNSGATTHALSNSNELNVVNGARVTVSGTGNSFIGGRYASDTFIGSVVGNQMLVGTNSTVYIGGGLTIGYVQGNANFAASCSENRLRVVGTGALLDCNGISMGRADQTAWGRDNQIIVEDRGTMRVRGGTVTVGGWEGVEGPANPIVNSHGNNIIVRDNGSLYATTVRLPGDNRNVNVICYSNIVEVTTGGLLEATTFTCYGPSNNFVRVHNGGIVQFRNVRNPTVNPYNKNNEWASPLKIENATVSYTNWNTAVVVRDNWHNANLRDNTVWLGQNTFRLNNCGTIATRNTNAATAAQEDPTYTFDTGLGATNYVHLQMFNGKTYYRNRLTGTTPTDNSALLTIGANGTLLCKDTEAFVEIPFTCDGKLTLANSTLTLERPSTITGEVVVDLSNLREGGIVLKTDVAKGGSVSLNGARIRFIGKLPEGVESLKFMTGVTSGRFATDASLPKNFSIKYDIGGAGNVVLHHALPRTLFILK